MRFAKRIRQGLMTWVALSLLATGIPWVHVHSYGSVQAHASQADLVSVESRHDDHFAQGHGDGGAPNGSHVHDDGLFNQCPGIALGLGRLTFNFSSDQCFGDPVVPELSRFSSFLLRPPAA